ncbi:hypothetical protein SFRURICE_013224, partial [Spodoptera frugiperda]
IELQNSNIDHNTIIYTNSTTTDSQQSTNSSTRLKWTEDINEAIIKEYYKITHIETNRTAYRKQLHTTITQQFPVIAHVSEQRIADQRRVILNNRLISEERLEEIKREVRNSLSIQIPQNTQHDNISANSTNVNASNPISEYDQIGLQNSTSDNTNTDTTTLQDETTTILVDETLDTKIEKTFEEIYQKYLYTDPTQRPFIPKQKTSKRFAHIISYLNTTVLPKYSSTEDDFLKTHTLVYCAAHTAALCNGTKFKQHNHHTPSATQTQRSETSSVTQHNQTSSTTQHNQTSSTTQHNQTSSTTQTIQTSSHTQTIKTSSTTQHNQTSSTTQHNQTSSTTQHNQTSSTTQHNQTSSSTQDTGNIRDKRPNWLRRLDQKILIIRKEIGRMTQYINGNRHLRLITHIEKIKHKYRTHSSYEEPNTTNEQFSKWKKNAGTLTTDTTHTQDRQQATPHPNSEQLHNYWSNI